MIEISSVLLSLWWAVRSFQQNVSIDLFSPVNKIRPYAARFLLSNNGPFRITNVKYSCEAADWRLTNTTIKTYINSPSIIPLLDPGDKRSLRCDLTTLLLDTTPPKDSEGFKLQVKITYNGPLFGQGKIRTARFALILDSSGELVWIPLGPTEGDSQFTYQDEDGKIQWLTPEQMKSLKPR